LRFPGLDGAGVGRPEEEEGDVQDVEASLAESGTPPGLLSGLGRQVTWREDKTERHEDSEESRIVFQ